MSQENLSALLDLFHPISLKELDEVKLMNRVDTKFAFSMDDLETILPELAK